MLAAPCFAAAASSLAPLPPALCGCLAAHSERALSLLLSHCHFLVETPVGKSMAMALALLAWPLLLFQEGFYYPASCFSETARGF